MECPCKDCKKKGCGVYHSQCKEYLEYVKWEQAINELEREEKQFSYNIKERRKQWKKNR